MQARLRQRKLGSQPRARKQRAEKQRRRWKPRPRTGGTGTCATTTSRGSPRHTRTGKLLAPGGLLQTACNFSFPQVPGVAVCEEQMQMLPGHRGSGTPPTPPRTTTTSSLVCELGLRPKFIVLKYNLENDRGIFIIFFSVFGSRVLQKNKKIKNALREALSLLGKKCFKKGIFFVDFLVYMKKCLFHFLFSSNPLYGPNNGPKHKKNCTREAI